MRTISRSITRIVTLLALALPADGRADTFVSGNVSGVWDISENPYVLTGDVVIPAGQTLTMLNGVLVLAQDDYSITVNGTLDCQGQDGSVVLIRSQDPIRGSWKGIAVGGGATVTLTHTQIAYGGSNGRANLWSDSYASYVTWDGGGSWLGLAHGVDVLSQNASFQNLLFDDNFGDGLRVNTSFPPVLGNLTSTNNTGYAYRILESPGHLPGNITGDLNGVDAIYVTGSVGGGMAPQTWIWGEPFLSKVIDQLTIAGGQTLEIQGGVHKFPTVNSRISTSGGGTLRTVGPLNSVFSSFLDDASGNDLNGDGNATSPAPGDWYGIAANGGHLDLNRAFVYYAGSGGFGNVRHEGTGAGDVSWNIGQSRFSSGSGMYMAAATADIQSVLFADNTDHGLYLSPLQPPTLYSLTANDNGGWAIYVASSPGHLPDNLVGSGNAVNGVYVNGAIGEGAADPSGPWVWDGGLGGMPFVVDGVTVPNGRALELGQFTVVKFTGAGALYVNGELRSPDGRVWFTSLADDSQGGDTNGDGAATSPAPGDWSAIFANVGAELELNDTWISYGGLGTFGSLVTSSGTMTSISWDGGGVSHSSAKGAALSSWSADLRNLVLEGNAGTGLQSWSDPAPALGPMTANDNGGWAIHLLNPGSIPSGFAGTGNALNGIVVEGNVGGTPAGGSWTWDPSPTFPVVSNGVSIPAGETLEIRGGTVVKSIGGTFSASGTLRTTGPAPVWFTSIQDDAHGGDTNNDGAATVPAPADWQALYASGGSTIDFTNTFVAYGGLGNLAAFTTPVGIANSLTWSGGGSLYNTRGMWTTAYDYVVTNVRFESNNGEGAIASPFTAATFDQCDFVGNGANGLTNNNPAVMIDATNCWWGHVTGPFDPTNGNPDFNPGGLGSAVSDWVDYRPFAGGPVTNVPPEAFVLVSPEWDETVGPGPVSFTWTGAPDFDGDAVTYDLEVSTAPGFEVNAQVDLVTGIAGTTAAAGPWGHGGDLYWRVIAQDGNGGSTISLPAASLFHPPVGTSVGPIVEAGPAFRLEAAAPNPFRTGTAISFQLPRPERVRLQVYNLAGRLVATLVDGHLEPGRHAVRWDGRDESGRAVAAGVYFTRLSTSTEVDSRRVVRLR